MAIFQREAPLPPNGTSNAGGIGRNRDSYPLSGLTAWCERCSCYQHNAAGPRTVPQIVTLIAGSKRPSLLTAENNDEVCDKKSQRYTEDNRTAPLIACIDKSVACITNNKRLYSMFCTVEANY